MQARRGTTAVKLVERDELPLAHLVVSVSKSACGQRMWAIRFEPKGGDGLLPVPMANGFLDTHRERTEIVGQLRVIADAMEAI